jgi:hypothetical protein
MRNPEVILERRLFARSLAGTFRATREPFDDLLEVATLGQLRARLRDIAPAECRPAALAAGGNRSTRARR